MQRTCAAVATASFLFARIHDEVLDDLVELLHGLENVDANAPVLVRRLEYPVVTSNKVTAGHEVASGALSLQHGTVLWAGLYRQVEQMLPYFAEGSQCGVDVVAGVRGILVHHDGRLLGRSTLILVHHSGALLASLEIFEERYKLLEEMFQLRLLALGHSDAESDWSVVEDVLVFVLQLLTKIRDKLVLPRQLLVAFEVVQKMSGSQHQRLNLTPTVLTVVLAVDMEASLEWY